ncbi:MAG: hypothetical protein ACYTXC_29330 [Nostoc sp.]
MPAVIAMTEKVTVKTALALCAKFYEQLNKSAEVDLVLQEAAASLAERQDITVPALFSWLGGRPLFSDQLDQRRNPKWFGAIASICGRAITYTAIKAATTNTKVANR